jgi:hypothetical protein
MSVSVRTLRYLFSNIYAPGLQLMSGPADIPYQLEVGQSVSMGDLLAGDTQHLITLSCWLSSDRRFLWLWSNIILAAVNVQHHQQL